MSAPRIWRFEGESRYWFESRHNYNFGREPDLNTVLVRNRLLLEVRPTSRIKIVGQVQDTRAPHYQRPRPGSAQDPFDLHEAYVEINPDAKEGWNIIAGRKRFFLGDQYFIGQPEWVNSGRTYDTLQVNYGWKPGKLRAVMISQVSFKPGGFNVPVLRDRLTGAYFQGTKDYDVYYLRHSRINLPSTNSVGARIARKRGPWRVSGEAVVQGAFGSVASISRKFGRLELAADYEFASPDFDQLYPAAHDRLGHGDVLIFRNVHSLQGHGRITLGKNGRLNLMYTSNFLADRQKPAYWFGGSPLPVPRGGYTASLIGQEAAIFSTHRWKFFALGVGFAQWFNGEPLKFALPGRSLRYAYVHTGFYF